MLFRSSSERKSPALSALSFDREFVRWMEEMQLQDVGFVGHTFTWRRGVTEARLDRFVANVQWCEQFLNARVFHLPSYKSDHCPILLKLDVNDSRVSVQRPFRFIASWILHENFNDFVEQNWNGWMDWKQNIDQFAIACQEWNKTVFGHIEGRKKRLLRRLDGVNRELCRVGNSQRLEELRLSLWEQLENTLTQEALLWAQKARRNWSVDGDRNTRLFHAQANGRRKINRVDALKIGRAHV